MKMNFGERNDHVKKKMEERENEREIESSIQSHRCIPVSDFPENGRPNLVKHNPAGPSRKEIANFR